jgi:acyl-coenzyme A thioesterase PaaI-like protein
MSLSSLHRIRHWAVEKRWDEIEKFFNESLQLKQIGATIDLSNLQKPIVVVERVTEVHLGGIGSDAVNGGVISMLVDLAVGLLGIEFYNEGMTATSQLSIHFLKPLLAKTIIFEAEKTAVVGNRIFGKVMVMNEKREVSAYASGVLAKAIRV